MKSLLISSTYFPPRTGGIAEIMGAIASILGPERVCCLTGVSANAGAPDDNCGPRVYRRPTAFAGPKLTHALGWGASITEIMFRERPQVVQLATAYEGYLGLWLRQWFKLPYVVYAYGNEILDVMRSARYQKPRIALQHANRIIAISRFTANLLQEAGVAPDQIEIVYPGCNVDRFRPLPQRKNFRKKLLGSRYGDRLILTVGGLVERKGQDMVIRALPRVCQRVPDASYLIVGDGPYRSQLEKIAVQMGVRDRVIFAGKIPNQDLAPLYSLCDIFVMPSRDQSEQCDVEGFGVVYLEANACGKPVIGGRSGGVPEAVADGVTGLLVDPHDPADIANAITRLLTDADLSARLGQQGRLRVTRDFTWARFGTQVQEILESTLRPGARETDNSDLVSVRHVDWKENISGPDQGEE